MKKYYENVILIIRGILEKQHRNRMSLKREKGRNMNYVGIDIGSTASKVVVEGDKKRTFRTADRMEQTKRLAKRSRISCLRWG